MSATLWAACLLARGAVDDGAATIELELATCKQVLSELLTAALDAGFCAGQGNAQAFGKLFLG